MPTSSDLVLVGALQHETNSFSPVATTLSDFQSYQYATGTEVIERYRGTGTELGGMIDFADRFDTTICATLATYATPSGMVTKDTFTHLVERLCDVQKKPSAAAIALHGSMSAAGVERADLTILEKVRALLPPRAPLVATVDFHVNLSEELVASADMLIGYETFPHTDMRQRGYAAMKAIADFLSGAPRPVAALRKLPLLPASDKQVTDSLPMRAIMDEAERLRHIDGIASVTVAAGYPFTDGPDLGMSVLVYGDARLANDSADRLAAMIWRQREDFTSSSTAVAQAVHQAMRAETPVVLVDSSDNVGGGAPGDSTGILAELLRQRAQGAVLVIWDPEAAARAKKIGAGNTFSGPIGAHSSSASGSPIVLSGIIKSVGKCQYARTSSYMPGTMVDLGITAVVEIAGNLVVLTTNRLMPFDVDHLTTLGIDPMTKTILTVKSGSAWRAAFGSFAKTVIKVDAPGVSTQRFDKLPYATKPALFPIDRSVAWPTPNDQ